MTDVSRFEVPMTDDPAFDDPAPRLPNALDDYASLHGEDAAGLGL